MRRPDYIPEGEEARYGITPSGAPGGPVGTFKDFVSDPIQPAPVRHAPEGEHRWPENVTAPRMPLDYYPDPGEASAGAQGSHGPEEREEDLSAEAKVEEPSWPKSEQGTKQHPAWARKKKSG